MTNLILLALLRERPMHGYELQQLIQTSRMDTWTNLLSGSIYYALNKMEQDGLLRTEAEERTGARLRKIYAITEAGEEMFQQMLRQSLTITPTPSNPISPLACYGSSICRRRRPSACCSKTCDSWKRHSTCGASAERLKGNTAFRLLPRPPLTTPWRCWNWISNTWSALSGL